jgi:hypothetical protein
MQEHNLFLCIITDVKNNLEVTVNSLGMKVLYQMIDEYGFKNEWESIVI